MNNATTQEYDIFIQQEDTGEGVNFINVYKKYQELSEKIDERLDKIRRKNNGSGKQK